MRLSPRASPATHVVQRKLKLDDPDAPTMRSAWGSWVNRTFKREEDF